MKKTQLSRVFFKNAWVLVLSLLLALPTFAQVTLEQEIKITDLGLHFDGSKVSGGASNTGDNAPYDFFFGRNISAHGDCIKTYNEYVFMTWYKGGKENRNVMLTRYNTITGTKATIEFPHRHTGFQNRWWIGESHNTIAVGISPLDGTIHLLYDMHAYSPTKPSDGSLSNDYFRYSYSIEDAASLPDSEFTLDKFVQNGRGGYKHLRMPGTAAQSEFLSLTYPKFFLNDEGDLLMYMRMGGNNNGAYKFIKYDASTGNWGDFIDFNRLNAKIEPGITHNWGLYGDMKYVNGKIRIGFQRRLANNNDKYKYQNGVYYAYSDDQSGATGWKNHKGEPFDVPLYDADLIKVMEPGDYVETTQKDKVYIVGGFDFTDTENEDVHIVSKVKDLENNVTKQLHSYKPAGATEFITEEFSGGSSLYTSGGNVYFIGRSGNGKIIIDQAEGGTNNFSRVYEGDTGKSFDHGVVHIANGKVYYYLMEDKSGSAQPLYLQIINLDNAEAQSPVVSFSQPLGNQTVDEGYSLTAVVEASDTNGTISNVKLYIDDSLVRQESIAPYEWGKPGTSNADDLNGLMAGSYEIKAVATDNDGLTSEAVFTLTVNSPTTDLSGVYRLKSVANGEYLDSDPNDVVLGSSSTGLDKQWVLVATENGNYNIESNVDGRGVLRAGPDGDVIQTNFTSPNYAIDKQWKAIEQPGNNVYRFESIIPDKGFLWAYVFAGEIGVSSSLADNTRWELVPVNSAERLNVSNIGEANSITSLKIYPNPANNSFTLAIDENSPATVTIFDILGKQVYRNSNIQGKIKIDNDGRFKSGIYLVKVVFGGQTTHHAKLVIE